jgi:hypothetical protein
MNDRLLRLLTQFCESAAWCYATGDRATGDYFIDSTVCALRVLDGADQLYDGNSGVPVGDAAGFVAVE